MNHKIIFRFLLIGVLAMTGADYFSDFCLADEQTGEENIVSGIFDMPIEELLNLKIKVRVASSFEESDLEVGSTVDVIRAENWRGYGASRINEVMEKVHSVMPLSGPGASYPIAMRGFASALFMRGTANMIDGVPINSYSYASAYYTVPSFDIQVLDRIEVIRGPGSAIYGSDAFHGVISMKTYEPKVDESHVEVQGSTLGGWHAGVKLSHAYFEDLVRVTAAVGGSGQSDMDIPYSYTDSSDGSIKEGDRDYNYNSKTAVLKVGTNSEKKHSARINFYFNDIESERFPGLGSAYGPSALQDKDWSGNDSEFFMTKAAYTWRLPKAVQTDISGYSWHADSGIQLNRVTQDLTPLYYDIHRIESREGVSVLIKQPDNAWHTQWALSYEFTRFDIPESVSTEFLEDGTLYNSATSDFEGYTREINSCFLQMKTCLLDKRWHILYGGRLDQYSDFGTQKTPRLGLIFQPTQLSAVKLLYGNAFRASTAAEQSGSRSTKGDPNIKPETIDTYELVYMQKGEGWETTATVFRNYWKDGISVAPIEDPEYSAAYVNIGKSESWGMEFAGKFALHNLAIHLNASYVIGKDVTDPDNEERFTAFPEIIANIDVYYHFESLKTTVTVYNRILDGMTEGLGDNDDQLPVYWRPDIGVHRDFGRVSIYLIVRNFLNRTLTIPSIFNSENGIEEPGINGILNVKIRF